MKIKTILALMTAAALAVGCLSGCTTASKGETAAADAAASQSASAQTPANGPETAPAQTASGTAVITNYGTITAYNLDLGTYSQSRGLLAQFDNFGTLTLANALRLQVKGTPSLFYNHAGATVRKTGGNQYTFYFGVDGNSANRACKIINEGDFFDNTTEIWMGLTSRTYSENEIIVQGNGRFFADKKVAVGFMTDSIATITLNDNGYLSGKATWHLGGSDVDSRAFPRAEGHIILNDNSFFMASNSVYVGRRADCIGLIALNDSSKMITARNVPVQFGFAANSVGTLTLTNSAVADFGYYVYVGSGTAARGFVSLAGDSRMYVTNNTLIVGYNNGATGVLSVAENAQLHAPILGIGQTSVAGTTGFVKLSGTATLFSTNISLPKWGGAGHGTLEVADNSVITNLLMMQVGQNAAKTSALVAMRGGSIFFDIDPESPEYMKDGYFNPLYLNPHLSAVKGLIRGWGKIAFSEPRTYVTEATIPSGITHYGQIIADGEGELRDLDFSRFGALNYANTRATLSAAQDGRLQVCGRLLEPRLFRRRTSRCGTQIAPVQHVHLHVLRRGAEQLHLCGTVRDRPRRHSGGAGRRWFSEDRFRMADRSVRRRAGGRRSHASLGIHLGENPFQVSKRWRRSR